MNKLIYVIAIGTLLSCSESKNVESVVNIIQHDEFDTLFINEDMRGYYGFIFKFDSLTPDNQIPRKVWVDVLVKGRDKMVYLLKHSNLYLNSADSNFQIKRKSKYVYKFFVNNKYHGYFPNGGPVEGQECLEIYPAIQPNEGYLLSAYWLDKPIKHPEITNVMVL